MTRRADTTHETDVPASRAKTGRRDTPAATIRREEAFYDRMYSRYLTGDLSMSREGFERELFLGLLDGGVNRHYEAYRCAFGLLGDVAGKRVLDFGCGRGMTAVYNALRGAEVFAFDISEAALVVTRRRAEACGVPGRVHVAKMSAYELAFPAGVFDLVLGTEVLHHVTEFRRGGQEIHRVLRAGGRAVFMEPLGNNPLVEFVRNHPFFYNKCRSEDELTLKDADIRNIGYRFARIRQYNFHILYELKRVVRNRPLLRFLKGADEVLFHAFPGMRKYATEVVIEYVKQT